MKKIALLLLVLAACDDREYEVTCSESGAVVFHTRGSLNAYKGSTRIYAADGRYIVPAANWTCIEEIVR